MNHKDFLNHSLSKTEKTFGTAWLLFETFFFASLLQIGNLLLPTPLSQPIINFIFFLTNFIAVAVIFRQYFLGQLRLIPHSLWGILGAALVGFILYMRLNALLMQVIFALDPDFISINDANVETLVTENYVLMFLGTVILVPITEECLFRGLVFRGIHDRSPVFAWILSVSLFASIHILGYIGAYPVKTILLCLVQYIPAGLCLAGAYRFSGNLLAPILIHTLVNLLGMLALR